MRGVLVAIKAGKQVGCLSMFKHRLQKKRPFTSGVQSEKPHTWAGGKMKTNGEKKTFR